MVDGITITKDVNLTKDVKTFVSSVNVNYDKTAIKDLIFSTNDDTFMLVTKKIGSKITITDVKVIDDDFIETLIS